MPISRVPGVGLDTGSSGVAPSNLSTGAPSWDGSGNLSFNSGYGSNGVAYGCRAWVNFNGTGTVAIRASGNVSSITDNGTGDYTVNFTTAMPDVNYSAVGSAIGSSNQNLFVGNTASYAYNTTSLARIGVWAGSSAVLVDSATVGISIFR